jgi:hypothetical protein
VSTKKWHHPLLTTLPNNRFERDAAKSAAPLKRNVIETVYLTDTMLGDNDHIIRDYIGQTKSGLYRRLIKYIEAGVVHGLFRDQVAIGRDIIHQNQPQLIHIHEGWERRGPKEAFTCQCFGPQRKRYIEEIDHALFNRGQTSVIWYSPDIIKSDYRKRITEKMSSEGPLRQLLISLPPDLRHRIDRVCESNEYFTNADLWTLLHREDSARDLISALGHINQQTYADFALSGLYGSDRGALQLAEFNFGTSIANNPSGSP